MTRSVPLTIEIEPRPSQPSQVDPAAVAPGPPCIGCRYAITCRTRQLACEDFMQYLTSGQWQVLPTLRLPTHRPTLRLFRH